MRITKLTRREAGHWSANVSVDGVTIAVDDRCGSWQTTPDEHGVTHGVLPWAAAELQERVTAVRLEQATDPKEREMLNALRRAALAAQRTISRPKREAYRAGVEDGREQGEDFSHGRTYDDPALNNVYDLGVNDGQSKVTNINAKAIAQRMAAAGAAVTSRGDDAA